MDGTPAGPADRGPAARKMDQAIDEHGTCHSVHRYGHIRQMDPGITDRKIHIVVGEDPVGGVRISFAPEYVDEVVSDDGVHTTAWLEHWGGSRPVPCGDIIHLHFVECWCIKSRAGATTNHIDLAPDAYNAEVVALGRKIGEGLPAIGGGIIDGEVIPARRATASDIDSAIHNRRASTGAGGRHWRAGAPSPTIGIEGIDSVHEGTVATGLSLATDNIQDAVHRHGHGVVEGYWEWRASTPLVNDRIIYLHHIGADAGRRISSENIDLPIELCNGHFRIRL